MRLYKLFSSTFYDLGTFCVLAYLVPSKWKLSHDTYTTVDLTLVSCILLYYLIFSSLELLSYIFCSNYFIYRKILLFPSLVFQAALSENVYYLNVLQYYLVIHNEPHIFRCAKEKMNVKHVSLRHE